MSLIGIILGAFLLFYLQDRLYCRFWDKNLSVSLEFSRKAAVEGEECELCERVENRKLLPLPALKVKFQVSRELQFEDEEGVSSVTDQYYRNDVLRAPVYASCAQTPVSLQKEGILLDQRPGRGCGNPVPFRRTPQESGERDPAVRLPQALA